MKEIEIRKQIRDEFINFQKTLGIVEYDKLMSVNVLGAAVDKIFGLLTVQVEPQVSRDFCGLTVLERKELEVIWNKLTNYGKQKMTYEKYLDAGLEIITMAYLTGKRDSKNSG